ncbi:MAG: hypothetical protein KDD50_04345 [Bdellovibrionales bacterium]|nr:hypothetical protein [Bdellovibrionales bacterium]
MAKNFSTTVPAKISIIVKLVEARKIKKLKRKLHSLKNTFGNIGSNKAIFCQHLEDESAEKISYVHSNLPILNKYYSETKLALDSYLEHRLLQARTLSK